MPDSVDLMAFQCFARLVCGSTGIHFMHWDLTCVYVMFYVSTDVSKCGKQWILVAAEIQRCHRVAIIRAMILG